MSKVPARWERIKRAVEIRDASGKETLIFGNGDVIDMADAMQKVSDTGCDGVMFGRAIFGNPWLFSQHIPSVRERLEVLVEHTKLFEKLLGSYKSFAVMKKHFKAYVNAFPGAVELRQKLMETENADEVAGLLDSFLKEE